MQPPSFLSSMANASHSMLASRAAPAITDDKHVDHQDGRSWSSDSETESLEITRTLSAARKEYAASSREAAYQILTANMAKAKQTALSRQQCHGPSSDFRSLSTARGEALPVHLHNIVLGASKTILANEMPVVEPLPPYKAWDYLVSNELAQGVGRQMYYTDEIGETIPLSDSDEEADSDTESLDGVSRQADMFLLNEALSQYGIRSDVVRIAAGMMKVKKASVQARMHVLAGCGPAATAACSDNQKLDVMIANFTNAFCRRCRVFNCFSHKGPHTKPQQRRPLPPAASDTPPCGLHCFKSNTSFTTLDAASWATSAADTDPRLEQDPTATQSAVGLQSQGMSQPARQATDGAEAKENEEEEEQELLPMRAAPRPAGPSGAVGQQPSAPAATSPAPWWSASERCEAWERVRREAVPVSPGVKAEHASNAIAGAGKPDTATMSTRKRKCEQSLLHEGTVTAARPASATAPAAADGAASSHAAHGLPASSPGSNQGSKMPFPMQSSAFRHYAHTHGSGDSPTLNSPASSSLPIILSDSEDEKPSPNPKPTPHLRLLQIPASNDPTSSPRQTPTPNPRTRNPPGFSSTGPSAAAGFSQGSADSPFVIVLSDSDDSNPPRTERTGEALAGLVTSKPNPNSQHQMTRRSTAKDSRRLEGTGCPSASNALPQAVPFNLEMKGSNGPSPITNHSPVNQLPASKQTPLGGSTERSLTLAHTSSLAADAAELQESVRQAARSCALLSVPRRPKSAFLSSHPSSEPLSNPSPDPSTTGPSSDTTTASAGHSQVMTPTQTPQDGSNRGAEHPDAGWTPFEVSVFDKAAEMYSGDSCHMARLVGSKNCSQVHARLLKVGLPAALAGAATLTAVPEGRGRWRKSGATKRKMRSAGQAKHVVLKRLKKAKGAQETPPYQPCQCKGACKEGCPCGDEGHFCEKFCACGPECQSRYKGCVCRGGCRTRACPCLASDRECDPDLCKPCQWSICSQRPPGSMDCQNMKLRLRQHKRVGMGLSRVAGWGAFAQEDIKKNEFVAEYTGELINHKEADRRGKAYDRDSNTYLFDLNDDWVIDAKHRGNKMRFANHSDQPNCRVQIKLVDGDHRVAIYAAQDIPTGTELLYNYGNRFGKV